MVCGLSSEDGSIATSPPSSGDLRRRKAPSIGSGPFQLTQVAQLLRVIFVSLVGDGVKNVVFAVRL